MKLVAAALVLLALAGCGGGSDGLGAGDVKRLAQLASVRLGGQVLSVAWSPDGRELAAANQDGVVRIWDVRKRKLVRRLRGHTGWTRGVDWSPNGDLIATSGADGMIRVWDAGNGKELRVVRAGGQEAWSVPWSPDGERLVSADGDGTVRIWGLR